MADAAVQQVRRFNRVVTERIGALDDHFLGHPRALGESRLLWEIGRDDCGCEVRALRARLGLDSGYLSRLLRSLQATGLIQVAPGEDDARVRVARLTAAGCRERATLDRDSDRGAESLLTRLRPDERRQLLSAMRDVERLLTAAGAEITAVDPEHRDAQRCLGEYVAELNRRSSRGFDPSRGVTALPHEMRPPAGQFFVVYLHGEPVGCGAVKHHRDAPAEIKRMWIAPQARGLGLGRRLLQTLEACALQAGASTLHIETNTVLAEALALYRSSGWVEVPAFNDEPFADRWLRKQLV